MNNHENRNLNMIEKSAGKTILNSTPIRISLNLTGGCNIRCKFCHLSFTEYNTKDDMSLETFLKLDEYLSRASYIVYFSATEPLFAKTFKDIYLASKKYEAEKYISTNGILIDEETALMFNVHPLTFLTVSIGGTDREMYKYYYGVDAYDKVISNIERINRIKKATGATHPRIRLVFVTTSKNMHMLKDAVELAASLKCSEGIKITYMKAYDQSMMEHVPFYYREQVIKYTQEAIDRGRELGVVVSFDGDNFNELDFEDKAVAHKPCFEPYERFHIESDGRVRPCPTINSFAVAGNVNNSRLEDIWNGEVYQKYRATVNSHNMPDDCKNCTHNFHKDFKKESTWDLTGLNFSIFTRKDKGAK